MTAGHLRHLPLPGRIPAPRHVWKRSKRRRPPPVPPPPPRRRALDPSPRWRVLESLWIHQQATERRRSISTLGPVARHVDRRRRHRRASRRGRPHRSREHLRSEGPRPPFHPQRPGRLRRPRRPTPAFRTAIGNRVTLADDDSLRADVSFSFPFFSANERTAFVNSDGNITFREGDSASTDRSVGRLLTGPPRVALFLADLDPSAGGGVFVNSASDQYTVTWCNVRGFESTRTTSAQATLLPDGSIEIQVRLRHHPDRCRRRRLARAHVVVPRRRSQRAGADQRRLRGARRALLRRIPISTSSPSPTRSTGPIPTPTISW